MPDFNVDFTPAAKRDLRRLDPFVRAQILRASGVLARSPFPPGEGRIRRLVGIDPVHFRLRVGDYRIVYRIEDRTVVVVRIAHRREAYR